MYDNSSNLNESTVVLQVNEDVDRSADSDSEQERHVSTRVVGDVEPMNNPQWQVAAFRVSGGNQHKIDLRKLKKFCNTVLNLPL